MTRTSGRLRRLLCRCAVLAIPATTVFSASSASAQGWLRDRRYQDGQGIKAGELELHPGIGAEVGYDSNWFLRSHKEGPNIVNAAPQNPVREGAILRITPSFSINTGRRVATATGETMQVEPRVLQLSGTVSATYREFFGAEELRKQRNVSANAGIRADINSGRPVAFALFAGYQRLIQPAVVSDPNLSFNRDDLTGGAEVTFMPGGGTLDLRGSYAIRANLFEESNGVPYNRITHEVAARNRWRFRPRTALFHETLLQFVTYPNADRSFNYLNDSTPLKTRFGVTGLVSEWFGTTLAVGYGATFLRNPQAVSSPQFDSVTAQAEGVFYLSKNTGAGEPGQATLLLSTITLGYMRDFQQSFLGNFYTSDRAYGRLDYAFGNNVVFALGAFGERLGYPPTFVNTAPGAPPTQVTGEFDNWRVGGDLFAEYRLSPTVGINTTISYQETISDTQLPAGGTAAGGAPLLYDLNWRRFQAFLGARWFF